MKGLKKNFSFVSKGKSGIIAFNYLAQILVMLAGLVQVKLLTNWLDVEVYGLFSEFVASYSLLYVVGALNMGHGFLRFASGQKIEVVSRYFWSMILIQLLMMGLIFIGISVFAKMMDVPPKILSTSYLILFLVLVSTLNIVSIQQKNLLIVLKRYNSYASLNFLIKFISVLATLIFAYYERTIEGIVKGLSLGLLAIIILTWLRYWRSIGRPHFDFKKAQKLIKFGVPLLMGAVSFWFITSGNRLIISNILGLESLGKFVVIMTVPGVITLSYISLSSILLSIMSKAFNQGRYDKVNVLLKTAFEVYVLLSVILSLMGFLISEDLIRLVSSAEYIFPGIHWVFLAGGLSSVFHGAFLIMLRHYDLEKLPKRAMKLTTLTVFLTLVLNPILIYLLGIIGALIGNIIAFIIGILRINAVNFPNVRPNIELKRLFILVVVFTGVSISLNEVVQHDFLIRFIAALSFGLILVFLIWKFKLIAWNEWMF